MPEKIYKYFSGDVLQLVFEREGYCGLKCSLPKDYNDPYELFLGVDLSISTDLLATYREVVRELPQNPTTCFSVSPVVAPMWAHYARNHSGFLLEFDVEILTDALPDAVHRDVTYKDTPDGKIESYLERSAGTMKPRHAAMLQQVVLSEAYFSKQTAWSYEQEHRLVVPKKLIEDIYGNMILFVPVECVTSIVFGSQFASADKPAAIEIAEKNNLNWFDMWIGKSSGTPYFSNGSKDVFIFGSEAIEIADNKCSGCSEPIEDDGELCVWCRISETHEMNAAGANPFRLLAKLDLLDKYLEDVAKMERGRD